MQLEDYKQHIWHPCSQMKDYEAFKPIHIVGAKGSHLYAANGQRIIDAISSWWCKSLGHNHPRLKKALIQQLDVFEHVILANTTNDTIVELSQLLATLCPGLTKTLFAGDGSCAIEIALKMSLHSRKISGERRKTKFISLCDSYHGETAGALSVSDLGLYKKSYEEMLFDAHFISAVPTVLTQSDPLWSDCSSLWTSIEKELQPLADTTTAIIVEPIVQGVGGMKIYSKDFLYRLAKWAKDHNIHLIADEIMTGFGRTGTMLACEHANITPDFLCLGKGLTSGWLPMACVMTNDTIYQTFYGDYGSGKDFLHSHTHSGNALAARVAIETIKILREEKICESAKALQQTLFENMTDIADQTGRLINVRGIGAIVAADLVCDNPKERLGYAVYQEAVRRGALLRPLGNTIYWLPPLNIQMEVVEELKRITLEAILSA